MRGTPFLLALALGAHGKNLSPGPLNSRLQAHQFEQAPSTPRPVRGEAEIVPGPVPKQPPVPRRSKAEAFQASKEPLGGRLVAHGPVEKLGSGPETNAAAEMPADPAVQTTRLQTLATLAKQMLKPEPVQGVKPVNPVAKSVKASTVSPKAPVHPEVVDAGRRAAREREKAIKAVHASAKLQRRTTAANKKLALPTPGKAVGASHTHHFGVSRDPAAPPEASLHSSRALRGEFDGAGDRLPHDGHRGDGGDGGRDHKQPPNGSPRDAAPPPGGMMSAMSRMFGGGPPPPRGDHEQHGGEHYDSDTEEHHDHDPSMYSHSSGEDHHHGMHDEHHGEEEAPASTVPVPAPLPPPPAPEAPDSGNPATLIEQLPKAPLAGLGQLPEVPSAVLEQLPQLSQQQQAGGDGDVEVVVEVNLGAAVDAAKALVADALFHGQGSGPDGQYTMDDWRALVENTQASCAEDFEALCGQQEDFHHHGPDSGSMDTHGHHHHHGHGHRMLKNHASSSDSSDSSSSDSSDERRPPPPHHHGGAPPPPPQNGGPHEDHHGHHEGDEMPCDGSGPLGFGSREADMCLKDHKLMVSPECGAAMAQTKYAFQELKSRGEEPMPPPHGPPPHAVAVFLLFFVGALCLCAGCTRKLRRRHSGSAEGEEEEEDLEDMGLESLGQDMALLTRHGKKGKMKALLAALADPANAKLKASLEDAAGVGLPTAPGWKRRVFAALDANPELKAALDTAVANLDDEQLAAAGVPTAASSSLEEPTSEDPQPSRAFKCITAVLTLVCMFVLLSLLFATPPPPREGQDAQGSPAEDGSVHADGSDTEGPPPPSPFEGFFFSLLCGLLFMLVCSALYRLCAACAAHNSSVDDQEVALAQDVEQGPGDFGTSKDVTVKVPPSAVVLVPSSAAVVLTSPSPTPGVPSLDEIAKETRF